MHIAQC